MTSETRERIKQYEGALPHIKEKITAAAVLLVIAMTIMVTATYAWITLSTSPEVTSIDTTVAANGALEIAMANGTGAAPGRSAAGDSTGKDNNVVRANNTWGNLVNLSDPSYGLANVVLRPAALNIKENDLLKKPLTGILYGADGRVSSALGSDDFGYAYYSEKDSRFLIDADSENPKLGVRAIASIQWENLSGADEKSELLDTANTHLGNAISFYNQMTTRGQQPGEEYISTLESLMQKYAQSLIDNKGTGALSKLNVTDEVAGLYNMLTYFNEHVMPETGKSYIAIANLLELTSSIHASGYLYPDENTALDQLVKDYDDRSSVIYQVKSDKDGNDRMASFKQYKADLNTLKTYLDDTVDFNKLTDAQKKQNLVYWKNYAESGGKVYWNDIATIINWMCSINTAELDGYKLSQLTSIGIAMDIINKSSHEAVLKDGAVMRAEQRMGTAMNPEISITVDASSISSLAGKKTIVATVTTDASAPYEMPTEIKNIKEENSIFRGGTPTAEDTYALAVDLWLRTNAGSALSVQPVTSTATDAEGNTVTTVVDPVRAYITLEGKILYKTVEEQKTITDAQGQERPAYMASATIDGQKVEQEVFKRGDSYFYWGEAADGTSEEKAVPAGITVTYTEIIESKRVVSGYDGVNRVWNDDQMAPYVGSGTSTTQGGGSCYTFYATNEADQSRFLELLGSMYVAFIDGNGNLIGKANMDTQNYYAENGKVTVPLALDTSSATFLGYKDEDGTAKAIYGLMPLMKNAATRVTAIVYLDGTKLTNQMVLASGDIQGNLNVQFGSYTAAKTTVTTTDADGNVIGTPQVSFSHEVDNESIEDKPLMDDTIEVTAKLTGNNRFEYDENNPAKTSVEVTVAGEASPSKVEVRFIRAISSTQGVLQEAVQLTKNGNVWTGDVTFAKPGNYILRTVWVDGAEYDMNNEPLEVTVIGNTIDSIYCDAGSDVRVMTANATYSTGLTLNFHSSNKTVPNKVNGIFMSSDGTPVYVRFELKESTWKGTATFTSSDTYTLKYVEIDGEQYEVSESQSVKLELLLGLKASASVTADDETLAKLKAIDANSTPTRFKLDTTKMDEETGKPILKDGTVTLQVAVKLYDNNGNPLVGLTGAKLYYSRAGAKVDSLHTDLKWNGNAYEGSFLIRQAGTYSFSVVTVTENGVVNRITAKTTASTIQVMPPEPVSYSADYTQDYQYAPNKDATAVLGFAYSESANITATFTKEGARDKTFTSIGAPKGTVAGNDTITLWSFPIPTDDMNDGLQEGEWKLTSVSLSGVYYKNAGEKEATFYGEENPLVMNLQTENIHTKVVNLIRVTLAGDSQTFTGDFMDSHPVNNMTVTLADYDGKPIQGVTYSNVSVSYELTNSDAKTYNYTTTNTDAVVITGAGTQTNDTTFTISSMNFRRAGAYMGATVTFNRVWNGSTDSYTVRTGSVPSVIKLGFKDLSGKALDSNPNYIVNWNQPDVKIIGTNPAMGKIFSVNMGGGTDEAYLSMQNYYEDYYACLGIVSTSGFISASYTAPQVTLKLENGGKSYQSATFEAHTKINGTAITCGFSFPTGKDTPTVTGYMGRIGNANSTSGSSTRGSVNETISVITMQYEGADYVLNLANPITIKTINSAKPRLDYIVPEEYAGYITLPATKGGQDGDGRTFKETLPGNMSFTIVEPPKVSVSEMGTPTTNTTTSNLYYSVTTTGCSGATTTYYPVIRTVETKVYQKELPVNSNQYTVTSWKIEKANYNTTNANPLINDWSAVGTYKPGKEIPVDKHMRATPVAEITSTSVGETRLVTYTVITTTDKVGSGTSTLPSGTKIDQSAVLKEPEVVETWS